MVTNGDVLVFGSRGNDFKKAFEFGLGGERHGEEFNGGVVNVVVGGDHAEVEGGDVHAVFNGNALGVLKIRKSGLGEKEEKGRKVSKNGEI